MFQGNLYSILQNKYGYIDVQSIQNDVTLQSLQYGHNQYKFEKQIQSNQKERKIEEDLGLYIKYKILNYRAIEQVKHQLSQKDDFCVDEFFQFLDKKQKARIYAQDILKGLEKIELNISNEKDLILFMKRYSKDQKSFTLVEFSKLFPSNGLQKDFKNLSAQTKLLLDQLFSQYLLFENQIEFMKRKVYQNTSFYKIQEIFSNISFQNKITTEQLMEYLNIPQFKIQKHEYGLILDKMQDANIVYLNQIKQEFQDIKIQIELI